MKKMIKKNSSVLLPSLLGLICVMIIAFGIQKFGPKSEFHKAKESVTKFVTAIKNVDSKELEKSLTEYDFMSIGISDNLSDNQKKSLQSFFDLIYFEYDSGEIKDGDSYGELTYKTTAKSYKDMIERNGPVSAYELKTVKSKVVVKVMKYNGEWIVKNGNEVLQKVIGISK